MPMQAATKKSMMYITIVLLFYSESLVIESIRIGS